VVRVIYPFLAFTIIYLLNFCTQIFFGSNASVSNTILVAFSLVLGRKESEGSKSRCFKNGGLEVQDLVVSDGKQQFNWSLVEVNARSSQMPKSTYFAFTNIDLENTLKYASLQTIRRIDPGAKLISVYKRQVKMIDIDSHNNLTICLTGIIQLSLTDPKAPPFLVSSFLVIWDLNTNHLRYHIIGVRQSTTPYLNNIDSYQNNTGQNCHFFDVIESHDAVFNANSVSTLQSNFGDIALYL
jgi:hypothetical protein